jgi:hypothetical protein
LSAGHLKFGSIVHVREQPIFNTEFVVGSESQAFTVA